MIANSRRSYLKEPQTELPWRFDRLQAEPLEGQNLALRRPLTLHLHRTRLQISKKGVSKKSHLWQSNFFPKFSMTTAIVALCSSCTSATGSNLGSSDGPSQVQLSTSFSSQGAPTCTTNGVTWGATPLNLSGSGNGVVTPQAAVDAPTQITPDALQVCWIQHTFENLHQGRWRLWVTAGIASGICDVDLKAGQLSISWQGGICNVS